MKELKNVGLHVPRPRFCLRYIFIVSVTIPLIYLFSLVVVDFQSEIIDYSYVRNVSDYILPSSITRKKRFTGSDNVEDPDVILKLPVGQAIHDNQRLLNIYNFIWTGGGWTFAQKRFDICLATQSSIDRLYWLPKVLDHWKGPLSLAVLIISKEEWLILRLFLRFLQRCRYPSSFGDLPLALHVAVPYSVSVPFESIQEDLDSELGFVNELKNLTGNETLTFDQVPGHEICKKGQEEEYMKFLLESFPIRDNESLALKEVYPQNHMRNIARKACGTDWTYLTDIDIIPVNGMAEKIQEFYDSLKNTDETQCKKCAYVIPTFELKEIHEFPKSKKEITKYFKSGDARSFHGKYFSKGHNATNYKLWTSTNLEDEPVKISHPVTSSPSATYLYEPFYISPDTIPEFDERFLGYGFTRNSQFQEALYAGWKFHVLTPIFSIHWGLQTSKTVLSKNVRMKQTSKNSVKFNKFLKELKLKRAEKSFYN